MLRASFGARWACVLGLAVLPCAFAAASAVNLAPEQVAQVRRWQVQDLSRCSSYRSSGEEAGSTDFNRRYPSCAHVYLSNDVFAGFFTEHVDELAPAQHCYYAGYKLGFIKAYQDVWGSCAAELSGALRDADQGALARCQTLATEIKDYQGAVRDLMQNSDGSGRYLADQIELAHIMALTRTGDYEQAWRRIVTLQGVNQRGLVPCLLLLGNSYKNEAKF